MRARILEVKREDINWELVYPNFAPKHFEWNELTWPSKIVTDFPIEQDGTLYLVPFEITTEPDKQTTLASVKAALKKAYEEHTNNYKLPVYDAESKTYLFKVVD